jgi:hypothetical protein
MSWPVLSIFKFESRTFSNVLRNDKVGTGAELRPHSLSQMWLTTNLNLDFDADNVFVEAVPVMQTDQGSDAANDRLLSMTKSNRLATQRSKRKANESSESLASHTYKLHLKG